MLDSPVSFFIGAHQDDWQIFHGAQAWQDVKCGARVVFIYLTAGDAGRADGWWQAREEGALATCSVITQAIPSPAERREFKGRQIISRDVRATRSYFLRLPDGGYPEWGVGFPDHGHRSLWKLMKGESDLAAVDDSTTYKHWQELVDTVEAIVVHEAASSSSEHPWINTSDYLIGGIRRPPYDHCDHYATGELVRNFALGKYRALYWAGYNDPRRTNDVGEDVFKVKQSLMIRYSAAIREKGFDEGLYENGRDFYDGLMRNSFYRPEGI